MNNWLDTFLHGDFGASTVSPDLVLLALLMAFALGHVIGWVYMATHVGLSYSQMFVASLVVLPAIVALVMALMAGDIVIAFGLLAVFAVVRFRNVLKDTRDTTFILWAIVEGMAVGTLRFTTAVLGVAGVSLIFLYLRATLFGIRHRYDVVVSLQLERADAVRRLQEILRGTACEFSWPPTASCPTTRRIFRIGCCCVIRRGATNWSMNCSSRRESFKCPCTTGLTNRRCKKMPARQSKAEVEL